MRYLSPAAVAAIKARGSCQVDVTANGPNHSRYRLLFGSQQIRSRLIAPEIAVEPYTNLVAAEQPEVAIFIDPTD